MYVNGIGNILIHCREDVLVSRNLDVVESSDPVKPVVKMLMYFFALF